MRTSLVSLALLMSLACPCIAQPPPGIPFRGIFRFRLRFGQLAITHVLDLISRIEEYLRSLNPDAGYGTGRSMSFVVEYTQNAFVRVRLWLYNRAFMENSDICTVAPSRTSAGGRELIQSITTMLEEIRDTIQDLDPIVNMWYGHVNLVLRYFGIEYELRDTPFEEEPGTGSGSGTLDLTLLYLPQSKILDDGAADAGETVIDPRGIDVDGRHCWIFGTSLVGGREHLGSTLLEGNRLESPNLLFVLTMETDCALVVSVRETHRRVWGTETSGRDSGCYLHLNEYGVLAIIGSRGEVWSKKTSSYGLKYTYGLAMENSGHAGVYITDSGTRIWSSP
ncbi:hypothetical protein SELMODRAFT_416897 [Selaginella moellendorffii]|uniref:Bulb-type lectin domain-containing protein n=1 Tax=Selaginella moellendorffii TaxID=88036 RepID=D8S0R3_SELML|nr:hypothetical protein SELMODRAFT_416897 [Selaginella moellendorffii]